MADFEKDVREAAAHAEKELQRLVSYINDEVVPDVRRHSSTALNTAADKLRELAKSLEGRK
jgi:bisphosphoglycerate-dependent phosphoglycerate mutase